MPKLYEYFGLIVFFYSNEHEPIHVHGRYQGRESKAEIIYKEGKLKEIIFSGIRGKRQLEQNEFKKFKTLVNRYHLDIVNKWIDFFVYNKPIDSVTITEKID